MQAGWFFAFAACVLFSGCRTEEVPITFAFKTDKHVINTDRGRLLVLSETECSEVETAFGAGFSVSAVEFEDTLVDEDRDLCDFINGFEIPAWPKGTETVAFVGYNVGARELSLSNCIRGNNLDRIRFDVAARDGFVGTEPDRCPTIGERCGGSCVVDVGQ